MSRKGVAGGGGDSTVALQNDVPWRASPAGKKPVPKIHHSPLLRVSQSPHALYAISIMKHPNPVGSGLGIDAIVEAAGPDCIVPGQVTPVKLLGLKVWPIEVDLKFMEPVGRELNRIGKFMDSAVNLMNQSFIERKIKNITLANKKAAKVRPKRGKTKPMPDELCMNASQLVELPQTSVFHLCFSPCTMVYQAAIKDAEKLRKGPWLDEEDKQLIPVVALWGQKRWDSIARASGLKRSGKSCRLRWLNYLRPNLKRDPISLPEEQVIIKLQEQWGNKWSRIARRLPGRTDNEIKNYWRTHLRKKSHSQSQDHISGFMDSAEKVTVLHSATVISGTSCDNFDGIGSSSSSGIENSPLESPSANWISGLSEDQQYQDCIVGSIYTSSMWNTGNDAESDAWDYFAGSFWDLELD